MYILTNNNNNNNSKADIYFKLTIKVSHCFFFPIGQTDSTDHSFGSRSVLSQQNWTISPLPTSEGPGVSVIMVDRNYQEKKKKPIISHFHEKKSINSFTLRHRIIQPLRLQKNTKIIQVQPFCSLEVTGNSITLKYTVIALSVLTCRRSTMRSRETSHQNTRTLLAPAVKLEANCVHLFGQFALQPCKA